MKNGAYTLVVAPDGYPGKRYRGRYCYGHIVVFWRTHGRMPKAGYIVHHLNDDKRDNSPGNLEEISGSDHTALHTIFARPKQLFKLTCSFCGRDFYRSAQGMHKTTKNPCCTRECVYKLQRVVGR